MRITNKMMTNNVLYNINSNKNALSRLEEQYSTGKKIQRASDDPIVATRALKLRTNLTELTQYYEKNIPDALAWMDLTESALKQSNEMLTQIHTYCVNGATDTLSEKDRNSIVANLKELRDEIYQQGNTNYAGRYVFSGYKTDTSLVFDQATTDYNYEITEPVKGTSLDVIQTSLNSLDIKTYDPENPDTLDLSKKPNFTSTYRIRLAYQNLKTDELEKNLKVQLPKLDGDGKQVLDGDGNPVYEAFAGTINHRSSKDASAYTPNPGEVNFLADTGELILSEDLYKQWKSFDNMNVTYEKDSFDKNNLRPEHYFDCKVTDLTDPNAKTISYTKSNQDIRYEINFSQTMVINTQGSDAISHQIGRSIDDIIYAVDEVITVDGKIGEVKNMLEDNSISSQERKALNEMLEVLNTEKTLKEEVLKNSFASALTEVSNQQNQMNVAITSLGSRYARLELTESRLALEKSEFTDLLSKNEDADLVDTIIKLKSQEAIYNGSLSAAAKIVKNSLLDFL